jgi:hypothetical protein
MTHQTTKFPLVPPSPAGLRRRRQVERGIKEDEFEEWFLNTLSAIVAFV